MDNNKDKTNSVSTPPVTPTPVIIVPSLQKDYSNYRHWSGVHQFIGGGAGDFSLDVNLTDLTYLELIKFECRTVLIVDSNNNLTLTNDYALGDFTLQVKKVTDTFEQPLGSFRCALRHDVIENEHLVWDSATIQKLRMFIDTANFESWTQGFILPNYNAHVTSMKVLLRFTFKEHLKSLKYFYQNPNIYL
jgi:hypothetical protein